MRAAAEPTCGCSGVAATGCSGWPRSRSTSACATPPCTACPKCKFKLFPVGAVRKIRFHHLRHTTASLLLMQGADLAAVQRIMRHQDPRITTEVYGHLAPGYLKNEINRLSFGPPPADRSAGGAPSGAGAAPEAPTEQENQIAASGAQEPPQLAVVRDDARPAAPFATRLLPNPQKAHAPPTRRGAVGKALRGLRVVGARGFEPPTFRSRTERATRLRHAPMRMKGLHAKITVGSQWSAPAGRSAPARGGGSVGARRLRRTAPA